MTKVINLKSINPIFTKNQAPRLIDRVIIKTLTLLEFSFLRMTNAIYLTTTEPYSGKSIIALGVMNLLAGKTAKIAFFKPVISNEGSEKDSHIDTIASYFNLSAPYQDMFVFTRNEVLRHINAGNEAYIIDTIIHRFKQLQE